MTMIQDFIKHVPHYQVIICKLCTEPHCIPLDNICKHFRTFHSDSLDLKTRKELIKYAQTFKDQTRDPNEVKLITPPFEEGPIEGLHRVYGFECNVCKK